MDDATTTSDDDRTTVVADKPVIRWRQDVHVDDVTNDEECRKELNKIAAAMEAELTGADFARRATDDEKTAAFRACKKMRGAIGPLVEYAHRHEAGPATLRVTEAMDGRVQIEVIHDTGHVTATLVIPWHEPEPEASAASPAAPAP